MGGEPFEDFGRHTRLLGKKESRVANRSMKQRSNDLKVSWMIRLKAQLIEKTAYEGASALSTRYTSEEHT